MNSAVMPVAALPEGISEAAMPPAANAEPPGDARRWMIAWGIAALIHAALAAAAGVVFHSEPEAPLPAAMAVELALPAAPPTPPKAVPPAPKETPPQIKETPKPRPKPAPKAEAVLSKKIEKPEPAPSETKPEAAPPSLPAPPAETVSAPVAGAVPVGLGASIPTWRAMVSAHLAQHKRYPPAAQSRRQQGIVLVWFRLDRQGRVIASRIERSSGRALLDQEVLDLLDRAQPLPPPPGDMPGDAFDMSAPVHFFIR